MSPVYWVLVSKRGWKRKITCSLRYRLLSWAFVLVHKFFSSSKVSSLNILFWEITWMHILNYYMSIIGVFSVKLLCKDSWIQQSVHTLLSTPPSRVANEKSHARLSSFSSLPGNSTIFSFSLGSKKSSRLYVNVYSFSSVQSRSRWTSSTNDSWSSLYLRKFFICCFIVIASYIYIFFWNHVNCYSLARLPGTFFYVFFFMISMFI